MKNIKILLILAVIASLGLTYSCSSNNNKSDLPLSLSLDKVSGKDSIFTGDTLFITGTAKATGKINMIQLFRKYPYQDGSFSESEVRFQRISNLSDSTTTRHFSFAYTGIVSPAYFNVVLTDRNGGSVSSSYSSTMRTSNINLYSDIKLGGWISNYGSCLDVETGTVYGGSKTKNPTIAPLLDIYFEDAKIGNTDLDSMYYNNVNRLPDTGIRFAKTTFTPAQFDKMKADDLFANMTATFPIIAIKTDDIIFFRAKSGKKGLLKIKSLTDPQGDLIIDEIIQK